MLNVKGHLRHKTARSINHVNTDKLLVLKWSIASYTLSTEYSSSIKELKPNTKIVCSMRFFMHISSHFLALSLSSQREGQGASSLSVPSACVFSVSVYLFVCLTLSLYSSKIWDEMRA